MELDDIYRFTSSVELVEHFNRWKVNYTNYRTDFQKIVDKYRILDARERHGAFFNYLFAEELEN